MRIMRTTLLAALLGAAWTTPVLSEEYTANTYMPDTQPLGKFGYIDFAKDIAKVSNGEITFKVFLGGVLVPPRASLSAIGDNIAQLGYFAGTYTPKELPVANLVASLAFESTDMVAQVLAVTEFSFTNEAQLKEWKDNKVVFGGGFSTPPYNLFCTTEVKTLADMAGKRVRMPGGVYERWARFVGATPVNISSNEMYTGLEKGALDCAGNSNDALKSHSLWEVAKFANMVRAGVYFSGAMYGLNPGFWAGLTPEQRKVMLDTMAVHVVRTTLGYEKENEEILAWAQEKGVKVVEPAEDLKAKTAEFISEDRKAQVSGPGAMEGAQAIIDDYLRILNRWTELLKTIDRKDETQVVALLKKEVYDKLDPATYGVQ
ncbi:C4-dicarboxylate TRAP transporter substrate-binding protein [Rhodoligotrophos defluvii]|uniref:C4-dicarboxylate TRAP transporter substrate-binding protein n=1 Tax=Rhodoligotrophos defluvii TaxID=2561934 RepID=UPI0010CA1A91|nr:C4-dicarboxylate TRAP transporter substrate-binding protein [Rhodoligotrophos defluvii]